VSVSVSKDRPGQVRRHTGPNGAIAILSLSSDGHRVSATLLPPTPTPAENDSASDRVMELRARAMRAASVIARKPGIVRGELRNALAISRNDMTEVVEYACEQGWVVTEKAGQAVKHFPGPTSATGTDGRS
jgi:hypothetical protein